MLQFYTNADAMIGDLENGTLQWVDKLPFEAVNDVKKQSNLHINVVPGSQTTNITWNSNPYKTKNRELLDPRVKQALSECVDRKKMIDVVFSGYATTVESIVGHISDMENPDLGPTVYDCDKANQALDELGYTRGPDGIRTGAGDHRPERPAGASDEVPDPADRAASTTTASAPSTSSRRASPSSASTSR